MITKKMLMFCILINAYEINIIHAMNFKQKFQLICECKLNALKSEEEKNEFAMEHLMQAHKNNALQELEWDGLDGNVFFRRLSFKKKENFAKTVLNDAYEKGTWETLGWKRNTAGFTLFFYFPKEDRNILANNAFAAKMLNDAYENGIWKSFRELALSLYNRLSIENQDAFALLILNTVYKNDALSSLGWKNNYSQSEKNEFGFVLFSGLSPENKNAFALSVLNTAYQNGTLSSLGWESNFRKQRAEDKFGSVLFSGLSPENKNAFALSVLNTAYKNGTLSSLGWIKDYKKDSEFGYELFSGLSCENKNTFALQILNDMHDDKTLSQTLAGRGESRNKLYSELSPENKGKLRNTLYSELSPENKNTFALSILNTAYKNKELQALGWSTLEDAGSRLYSGLSPENKNAFALSILNTAYKNKELQALGWKSLSAGFALHSGLSPENQNAFALSILNTAYKNKELQALGWNFLDAGSKLHSGLSPENKNAFSLSVLNGACEDEDTAIVGSNLMSLGWKETELGYILFTSLSPENKTLFAMPILNAAYYNNTLDTMQQLLSLGLFSFLTHDNKICIAHSVIARSIVEVKDNKLFSESQFITFDEFNKPIIMLLKTLVPDIDFFKKLDIPIDKKFPEMTIHDISEIVGFTFGCNVAKKEAKNLCISYLKKSLNGNISHKELVNGLLPRRRDCFNLLVPLLNERTMKIDDDIDPEVKELFNEFMRDETSIYDFN